MRVAYSGGPQLIRRVSLGDTTTTPATATAAPSFFDGLKKWTTPGAAFSALSAEVTASNRNIPYLVGLAAVPAAGLLLLQSMTGGRRRR